MFNSSNLIAKAMVYNKPVKNKHSTNKVFVFGKKKNRYYLPDSDYYWNIYLKSEHWKVLRHEKLLLNPVCEECSSNNKIDVHHINYRNLYDVKISDLKTLCRKHHDLEHKIPIIKFNKLRQLKKLKKEKKRLERQKKREEYFYLCFQERVKILSKLG